MKKMRILPSVFFASAIGLAGLVTPIGATAKNSLSSPFSVVPDSVGAEVVGGKLVIIHKLQPKETYYGLSRRYGVPVADIIQANNNKALKIGETVRIPTAKSASSATITNQSANATPSERSRRGGRTDEQASEPTAPLVELPAGSYTTYIIGRGETLFSVSRRFRIPVESIKLANGLVSDAIKEGMHLRIPKEPIQAPTPEPAVVAGLSANEVLDTASTPGERSRAEIELAKNRYGLREATERGVGVWIDDLVQDGASMLALHKSIPVGTVVKVTNPMTNHSTFVKVVGKFIDNAETQGAIIVLSKSVASVIGILDRRFQIEIAYGAPVEPAR